MALARIEGDTLPERVKMSCDRVTSTVCRALRQQGSHILALSKGQPGLLLCPGGLPSRECAAQLQRVLTVHPTAISPGGEQSGLREDAIKLPPFN